MNKELSLIRIASVPTEWEASVLVNRLDEQGITAKAAGGFTAGFRAEAPGSVDVLIDSRDQERAIQIIRAVEQERQDRKTVRREKLETQATGTTACRSSRWHKRLDFFAWFTLINLVASPFVLGPTKGAMVLALGALIVVPAIWFRRKFA